MRLKSRFRCQNPIRECTYSNLRELQVDKMPWLFVILRTVGSKSPQILGIYPVHRAMNRAYWVLIMLQYNKENITLIPSYKEGNIGLVAIYTHYLREEMCLREWGWVRDEYRGWFLHYLLQWDWHYRFGSCVLLPWVVVITTHTTDHLSRETQVQRAGLGRRWGGACHTYNQGYWYDA